MKTRQKKRLREENTFLSTNHMEASSTYGRKGRSPVAEGGTGVYWDEDRYGRGRRTLEEAGRRGRRLGTVKKVTKKMKRG